MLLSISRVISCTTSPPKCLKSNKMLKCKATRHRMSYDITRFTCYPTQVNSPHLKPSKLVLDLSTSEGWKTEFI